MKPDFITPQVEDLQLAMRWPEEKINA